MKLFQLKEILGEAGALITFSGQFSHSIIEELGLAVKAYLKTEADKSSVIQDVFSVYIEAAQNLRNYAAQKLEAKADPAIVQSGILAITRRGEHYEVHAGNVLEQDEVASLRQWLDHLATLDKVGLKALYKERLRKEASPSAKGAGLGFIEMARRASEPLGYEFIPLPDSRAFFSLRVVV